MFNHFGIYVYNMTWSNCLQWHWKNNNNSTNSVI